jgi:anti-sigma regulatory factor (Ser/Thr protein kinase)
MATKRTLTSAFTSRAVALQMEMFRSRFRTREQGFDSNEVPDPTTPENRLVKHGRGINLMRTLMDEVRFEQGGALVYMRKKPNAGSDAERKAG